MSPVTSTPAAPREYWRSLDQLQQTPEFVEFLHREFPVAASEFPQGVSRRRWLQLMGASFALTGLTGCRWEKETIAPFANRPANRIPGVPQHFATSWDFNGVARPLVVTCYDGRPIKVEGNRKHPLSNGAANAWAQASILSLYDPDRSQKVLEKGKASTWEAFQTAAKATFAGDGEGIRILSGAVVSSRQRCGRLEAIRDQRRHRDSPDNTGRALAASSRSRCRWVRSTTGSSFAESPGCSDFAQGSHRSLR